jgi:hypothetical protein
MAAAAYALTGAPADTLLGSRPAAAERRAAFIAA